jgi:UDP-glucuronate 4-epimerase
MHVAGQRRIMDKKRHRAPNSRMKILVTGSAGFIGFHLARRLLADGHVVDGIDSMVPYYDVRLKQRRHALLAAHNGFHAEILDLADAAAARAAVHNAAPDVIVHLAAQAGVRYALDHPAAYVQSNIVGTFNLLEYCRARPVTHLLLASTSSAYGANTKMPFQETDPAETPLNIYAATKRAGELMAHSYAHLWSQPTTAFRFFTVYGPWGRPDMALFKFTAAISAGQPIDLYNHGEMARDFTYIDDLIEAIIRLIQCVPAAGQAVCPQDTISPVAPYRLVNIGNSQPQPVLALIEAIEACLGKKAIRHMMDMQPGEVAKTWSDSRLLEQLTGFRPDTPLAQGVAAFVAWYQSEYQP